MENISQQQLPSVPVPKPITVEDYKNNVAALNVYNQSLDLSYRISKIQTQRKIKEQVTQMEKLQDEISASSSTVIEQGL